MDRVTGIGSHLNVDGTPTEDWRLEIGPATTTVGRYQVMDGSECT